MSTSSSRRPGLSILGLVLVAVAALALRGLRLGWQPLWWDEGYSIYFATEPFSRMVWLTAHDIHPPLYYALLHGWAALAGAGPESARILSALIGALAVGLMVWLGSVLFPNQRSVAWTASLLLAINPMHLYYSQEVRMYGLAMLLGMLSSGMLWLAIRRTQAGTSARGLWIGYVLASAAALYTLYYAALLIAAQAVWALWALRKEFGVLRRLLLAWAALLLLLVPWLVYALPSLFAYISQKVTSDQDRPLNMLEYALQHARALVVGHVAPQDVRVLWATGLALLGLILIGAGARLRAPRAQANPGPHPSIIGWLSTLLFVPLCAGFLLNLRLPFFPVGGERLMLIILPYALLLVAAGIVRAGPAGIAGGVALTIASLCGVWVYYTTPRYTAEDYRPIIRQVVTQGAPEDTLLATYPWMIGYWRAYAPEGLDGPTPELLSDAAISYGPQVDEVMRSALDRSHAQDGKVWFPEPLAYGSTLPQQMEAWLLRHAENVENRWFADTTRLTAWAKPGSLRWQGQQVQFGPLSLVGSALSADARALSNNSVLPVGLAWEAPIRQDGLAVSLRLVDADGRIWATREYAPPGEFAAAAEHSTLTETVGLVVPSGVPPGDYLLTLAIASGADAIPVPANSDTLTNALQAPLARVRVELPTVPPSLERLPMVPVRRSRVQDGLTWGGSSWPSGPGLAGSDASIELVGQSLVDTPPRRTLYLNLVDDAGDVVASWDGWPLDQYPTSVWSKDMPVRVPVTLHLPADVLAGDYMLEGGWVEPESGARSPPVEFGRLNVTSRPLALTFAPPEVTLEPAPQFGTHARLRGYTLERSGDKVALNLTWEVLQTLLPPHHIFVHADDGAGVTLAQADGPPITADGNAPTGTWRPGEFLVTSHVLDLPASVSTLRLGLYNPDTGIRLPVTLDGVSAGDAVTIDLSAAPPQQ